MTNEEIKALLEITGLPVAYRHFSEPQEMPFICYLESYSNNFSADGAVYLQVRHMQIELYTEFKNEELEDKVENTLSSFFWQKSETYIDSEQCYQIVYEIEV